MSDEDKESHGSLSEEDLDLWKALTEDVRPIDGKGYQKPPKKQKREPQVRAETVSLRPSTPSQSPSRSVQSRDIDRKTRRQFERGEIPIEATLDLHGMNQPQARERLIAFIHASHNAGRRCVLVITGKGNTGRTSDDWLSRQPGVLKRNVPQWLYEPELDGIVLDAVRAKKHGGDGALYVYLRRRR